MGESDKGELPKFYVTNVVFINKSETTDMVVSK